MTALEQLGSEKFVLLTTFRRDGRAVPTALWAVPDTGGLAMWTAKESGKVKRIRNSSRVTLQACDRRGTPTAGAPVEAVARIGDDTDRARIERSLTSKYGLMARLVMAGSRLRRGKTGTVVIRVSPAGS